MADAAPIRILIVDDHAMVRSGLRLLLEEQEDFSVVGEAGDVDGALRCAGADRPTVILLDLNMPGRPSLPAIPELIEAAPGAAVVVMTQHDDPEYARAALLGGASGFVLKEAAQSELVDAVHAAAAGRTYVNPNLGARLVTLPPPPDRVDEEAELAIGSTFAGHRIDAIAGRGGMGVVYRATDLTLDRPVALKLLVPTLAGDPVFRARFERECRLAAALDHPHVVPIFHAGAERGALYLTMRYIEGTDLRSLLAEEERLEPSRAVRIVAQVAAALTEAHRHGLVHRDVKPANILIATRDGARARLPHRFRDHDGPRRETTPASRRPASRSAPPTTWRPSRRRASASTPAPTSTRSAASSTGRSPAPSSTTRTATSRSCGRTSTNRLPRCSRSGPGFPRRSAMRSSGRWPRLRATGSRRPESSRARLLAAVAA